MSRPLPPGTLAQAVAACESGEATYRIARRLHVRPERVRAELERGGIPLRSKAEQASIGGREHYNSVFRRMTREQLHALYWSPEQPSIRLLSTRLGESFHGVRAALIEHGIPFRDADTQMAGREARGWRRRCNAQMLQPSREPLPVVQWRPRPSTPIASAATRHEESSGGR